MSGGAAAWLAVLLALGGGASAYAAPIDTLEDCGTHLAPQLKGIEALNALCPGLEDALQSLGLPDQLPTNSRVSLTLQALRDVAGLTARYQRETLSRGPDAASLKAILSTLERERVVKGASWFDMLLAWLRSLFAKTDAHSLSWLQRLLDRIDAASSVIAIATYTLLALVLLGALVFIVRELNAAGLFGRRQGHSSRAMGPNSLRSREVADNDFDGATLYEKPSILLRKLVAALSDKGRLDANRHLTHRELVDRASFDDADQRRQLGVLASVAEEIVYGPVEPSVEKVNAALREGQGLLAQIDLRAGAPG